jgi:glucose 1-dehydrogenase
MTRPFTGQAAIITGAGVGIGYEIARQLADQGAGIVLNDIDAAAAQQAATQVQQAGGQCETVIGDASELHVIETMIKQALDVFGGVHLAVANAGITTYGDFLDYTPDDFHKLMAVNLQGSFFLAQRAARQMIAQRTGGRLLLMSSVTGVQAHPNLIAYGMTKAALRHLAKTLGADLAPRGITVNALAPGATLTERTMNMDGYEQEWSRLTPTGRPATPDDIAQAALFLLSPGAGHITGQTLIVDGGWTAVSPPPDDV